ncbi:MAG: hypothetical protein HYZ38_24945 [Mycobacterium sp.]|nr:hypothetical protein [Mycobacterium sp.]
MTLSARRLAAIAVAAAALPAVSMIGTAVSHADEVCPVGMYWDVYSMQCLYYDVDVYVNPPNPIVGPVGPVGVGGLGPVAGPVGPVGVGGVGPVVGPVGPVGIGRR